jgi:hypothetical protein
MNPTHPHSSGAGGPDFERRVATMLACQALVGMPSVPLMQSVNSLWLQCGHLGSEIEDILVEAATIGETNDCARCYWSIKTTVSLTAGDREFREFCSRSWCLFQDSEHFDAEKDWIALGVSTSRSPRHRRLIELCEISRNSKDADDLQRRISLEKYHHAEVRELYATIRRLAGDGSGKPDDEQMFHLLRRLHVASFDLDQEVSQDKTRTLTMLSLAMGQPVREAASCWNDMFERISLGAGKARNFASVEIERLAGAWGVKNHITQLRHQKLSEIRKHCELTQERIDSCLRITGHHLERRPLIDQIRRGLEDYRIVLVRGIAGCGKSGAALQVALEFAGVDQVFCFRAEEFLHPHLDTALHAAGLREVTWQSWSALMTDKPAVLLVDSMERLLQREESREAFLDLIKCVTQERRWRLVLTCRESMAEPLHHELIAAGVTAISVQVPELTDQELDVIIVGTRLAEIASRQSALKRCLKNLKWLDLGLQALQGEPLNIPTSWSTESACRRHIWHFLVKRTNGLERENCLITVAQARLRSTQGWIEIDAPLRGVAQGLEGDGLLRSSGTRFTPAHDLIEDWALLTHLDQVAMTANGSLKAIIHEVGDVPLMRSCFRHWLGERLDDGQFDALPWLRAALETAKDSVRWQEEALLAILGARDASRILFETAEYWVADKGRLFKELLRCLQMAYVTTETVTGAIEPSGPGWAGVLDFTAAQGREWLAQHLAPVAKAVLLWKSAVTMNCPEPSGIISAAKIALMIWAEVTERKLPFEEWLSGRRGYLRDEDEPLPQLIAALASVIPVDFFESLMNNGIQEDDSDWQRSAIANKVIACVTGSHLSYSFARAHPDLVTHLFRKHWGLVQSLRTKRRNRYSRERGLLGGTHDFQRSSAIVGPFLALLRHHRNQGISFIIELLNFSIRDERASRDDEIDILESFQFAHDGQSFEQWGHQGWWRAYRGWSAHHYLEESSLMALEKWLLEDVALEDDLEATCQDLMQRSENLGVTAVIASVATAFPQRFLNFPLLILQQPNLISLDRHRHLNDQTNRLARDLDDSSVQLKKERLHADNLAHRALQLEDYIIAAQFGPARENIQFMLLEWQDKLARIDLTEMNAEQADRLGVVRLLMHRMDVRNLAATPLNDGTGRFALVPASLPNELQAIVNEAGEAMADYSKRGAAFMWASQMFDAHSPAKRENWREMLRTAQSLVLANSNDQFHFGSVPSQVAAACATFCWDELSANDRKWCCEKLAEYMIDDEPLTTWSGNGMPMMKGMHFGHVAHGLGVVCAQLSPDDPLKRACLESCAIALSHPEEDVAKSVASGLSRVINLATAKDVQISAVQLMFHHARAEHDVNYRYRGPNSPPELNWEQRRAAMHTELLSKIRNNRRRFIDGAFTNGKGIERWFIKGFTAHQRLGSALGLLLHHDSELDHRIFNRASRWLFCGWAEGMHRSSRRRQNDDLHLRGLDARNPLTVGVVGRLLAQRALLRTEQGLMWMRSLVWKLRIAHLREHAREALDDLVIAADSSTNPQAFWPIWRECRDAVCLLGHFLFNEESLIKTGISKNAVAESFASLMSALFFNKMNFSNDDSWIQIREHAHEVQEAFVRLGPISMSHFVQFLGCLGGSLLPKAWEHLDESYALFHHKVPLSAFIKGHCRPVLLRLIHKEIVQRRIPTTNQAAWGFIRTVLDDLCDQGSADAFHLRETLIQARL